MNLSVFFCNLWIFLFLNLLFITCQKPSRLESDSQTHYFNHHHYYLPLLESYSSQAETAILDEMFEQFRVQWEMVGISVAIVKDGRLIYAKGFGWADREKKIPAQAQSLYRIASVSKLFTAVGIMKLLEAGKLKLSDKIFGSGNVLSKYDHYIADTLAYKITIENLLTHTGGWRNILRTDPMFVPVLVAQAMKSTSPPDFETIIKFMLSQRGMFEPGTLYDYSNFGYCLLGKIIEQKTGMTYEEFMQKEILNPLKINRMRIGKNRYIDRFAGEVKYYDHKNAEKNLSIYQPKDSASRAYEGTNTEALGAAGGWIASVVDLMRFITAIDGFTSKPDILKAATIQRMTTSMNPKDSTERYLLGWKQVDEEKWWRTGSLSSTGISVTRRHDSISWVMVSNTGSWRGPFFSYEIEGVMRRAVEKIKKFPDYDLFDLAE